MRYRRNEGIPVLIHHIVDDHTGCEGQVIGFWLNERVVIDLLNEDDFLFIGREQETGNVFFFVRKLPTVVAIGIHRPQLVASATITEK